MAYSRWLVGTSSGELIRNELKSHHSTYAITEAASFSSFSSQSKDSYKNNTHALVNKHTSTHTNKHADIE